MCREQSESLREGEEKWQTYWYCQDQRSACGFVQASSEKLEQTGPAEKERMASAPQSEPLARMPEPPFSKENETEPSVQTTGS